MNEFSPDYESGWRYFVEQSGNEKAFRTKKFEKSRNSRRFDREKHKASKSGKKWDPEFRRKQMSANDQKIVQKFKKYEPHSGSVSLLDNVLSVMKEQASLLDLSFGTDFWSHLEGVTLLCTSLMECHSTTQAISIIGLYLKSHYKDKSFLRAALKLVSDLLDDSDDVVEQSGAPDWLDLLRGGMTNWKLITSNPVFKKISYLISICITLGLCDAANFEWKSCGIKLFCIPALEKHFGAMDLVDAVIDTVVYFIEGGYACFTTGSLAPFLYSDHAAQDFDNDYTFVVTNLEHVKTGNLRRIAGIDENDFDGRISKAIKTAEDLVRTAKGSWEKKIFSDKLLHLRKARSTFDTVRVQGGLRIQPFTVSFFGKSAVGKSSLSTISMVMGLVSNGFSAEDDVMVTLNESDKYMSNYRSFVNGVFLDDVGNTKADFVEKAPTNKMIEICNNVRCYANMAEADMKGKVSIEPRIVHITTNVKDLCASTYSNEPVSIARRATVHVTVTVKPEFCTTGLIGSTGQQLDSDRVAAYYTNEEGIVDIPLVPDLWNLRVERAIPAPQKVGSDVIAFEPYIFEGKEMVDVSIHTYLRFMIGKSRAWFESQERLVAASNNIASRIEMCSCGTPAAYCDCVSEQAGYMQRASWFIAGQLCSAVTSGFKKQMERRGDILERIVTKKLLRVSYDMETNFVYSWSRYFPRYFLTNPYMKQYIMFAMRDTILSEYKPFVYKNVAISVILACLGCCVSPIFLLPILYCIYRMAIVLETTRERVYGEIVQRNDATPSIIDRVRQHHVKYSLYALGAFGSIYTLFKVWKLTRRSSMSTHGALEPTCKEDYEERDAQKNPWAQLHLSDVPSSEKQETSSVDQVVDLVHKNQVFLRVKEGDEDRVSGGIFLSSNVLLMPYHMWHKGGRYGAQREDELLVRVIRTKIERTGSMFTAFFSSNSMIHIPDTDMCIVWVPNAGSYRDISHLLPIKGIRGGLNEMIFRDINGGRVTARGYITPGRVGHARCAFNGASVKLSIPTFNGLCMATYIAHGRSTHITGFHIGGKTNTPMGVLGTVTIEQYMDAISRLKKCPLVVLSKSEGTMPTQLYGEHFFEGTEIHEKSPVHFLEQGTNFKVFGSSKGIVSPHSNVVTTCISDTVARVCNVPCQWGAPQFKPAWRPWQESLKYSSKPSHGLEGKLLAWAVMDYKKPLIDLIKNNSYISDDIQPLTKMQVVCGIDGKRFIDKMPPRTSVGYPLTGPKSAYLTKLDPEQYPDQQFPVELDEMFWIEVDKMEQKYLAGERAYPIFKGCLKDEPTKLSKSKVRVFQAAPVALQILVRKYFLPIARMLSMHPIVSECAVGINSQGPEWNTLQKHIVKFGEDRVFAGDYSKYDLRMPAQIMFAAFRVLIDIARETGNYSEADISIMEGITSDICYPVMAYNGTLLQLIGTNPSGQNLTVYVNSIAGCLLARSGMLGIFTKKNPLLADALLQQKLTFRDICAFSTYGDDAKGSVARGFDDFNHIAYANFMAEHDIVFTMPDKESTPTPYMHDSDADFLKRKNVMCEEVGMLFGALDEMSIFKSLHATLESKFLSAEEQAIENINGALREWFAHGRDIYELRRSQMKQIADEHNLICCEVDVSYDDRMTAWKDKYLPDTQLDTTPPSQE